MPVETATADSFARLTRLGDGCLVLTARRAGALELPINGHPVLCLPLSDGIDLDTARRLSDPTHGGPASARAALRDAGLSPADIEKLLAPNPHIRYASR